MFEYDLFINAGKHCILSYTGKRAKDLFEGIKRKIVESEQVKLNEENKGAFDSLVDFFNG